MVKAYCVKCRKTHDMGTPKLVKKKGRYMLRGKCPHSSIMMTKFIKKEHAKEYEAYAPYETKMKIKYDAGRMSQVALPPAPEATVPVPAEPVAADAPDTDTSEVGVWEEPSDAEVTADAPVEEPANVEESLTGEVPEAEDEPVGELDPNAEVAGEEYAAEDDGAVREDADEAFEDEPEFEKTEEEYAAEEYAEEPEDAEAEGEDEDYEDEEPVTEEAEAPLIPGISRDTAITIGGLAVLFSIPLLLKALTKK